MISIVRLAGWVFAATLTLGAGAAIAQAASAPSSPAKKELLARVIKLHQPGLEGLARTLTEQPVQQMMGQLRASLTRVPQDKREAIAREMEGDVRRYLEESVPLVRERALALGPSTLGPMLDQRFSEDELRQIIAMLESPVNQKYQAVAGEMQRALGAKLVAESRAAVEPKFKALEQALAARLRAAIPANKP